MIEQIDSTTYQNLVDWPIPNQNVGAVDIRTEIGGTDPGEFFPEWKVEKWENEVHWGMRLQGFPGGSQVFDGSTVTWSHSDGIDIIFRDTPEGFESELVLTHNPAEIKFSLDVKKLTVSQYEDGSSKPGATLITDFDGVDKWKWTETNGVLTEDLFQRPEFNTAYEILFDSVGGKYQTGTAFHLFRPKAINALNEEIFLDHNINNPVTSYEITGYSAFIDDAIANGKLPVRIR